MIHNSLYTWKSYSVLPLYILNSSIWCDCSLIFKYWITMLVVVKSLQPCFLVLIGPKWSSNMIEYTLHKIWCLIINLFLPLGFSPIILPCLHLTPPNPLSPWTPHPGNFASNWNKKSLIYYLWYLFYDASYSAGDHTSKLNQSISRHW